MKRIYTLFFILCAMAFYATAQEQADTIKGKDLKEVEIVHETVKRTASQDLVTITADMRKGSHNTGELLGRLQGMHYDPLSQSLSYMGLSNIKILVDSLEKDESYIKKIRHNRFDKIDVIYKPSGEYSSYDVLINLRTNPNYEGYEGYLQESVQLATGDRNGKGNTLAQWGNFGAINYMRGKWNFTAIGSYQESKRGYNSFNSRDFILNGIFETTLHRSRNDPATNTHSQSGVIDISADYRINDRHSLSVVYQLRPSESRSTTEQQLLTTDKMSQTSTIENNHKRNTMPKSTTHNGGIVYRGREGLWNFSARFNISNRNFDTRYEWMRTSQPTITDNRHNDFTYTYSTASINRNTANGKWQFSLSYTNTWQKYVIERLDTYEPLSRTNNMEHVVSLWAQWNPSQKWSVMLSTQLKHYYSNTSEIKYRQTDPLGWISLFYRPTSKLWFRAYYELTTTPPGSSVTTDYGQFTENLIWKEGNPLLKGGLQHQVQAVVGIANMITLRGRYFSITKYIGTIYDTGFGMRPDGTTGTYVTQTYQTTPLKGWDVTASFQKRIKNVDIYIAGGYKGQNTHYMDYRTKKSAPWGNLQLTYNLYPHDFSAALNYQGGLSMQLSPQELSTTPYDQFYIELSKTLFNRHLHIQMYYILPLHFTSGEVDGCMQSPGLVTRTWGNTRYREDNSFYLNVTYSFWGGGKVKKYNDKEIQNISL